MKRIFFVLIVWLFAVISYSQQITPANALQSYLNNGDPTWGWEVRDTYKVGGVPAYSLLLVSQKWQGMMWKHEMIVFVPEKLNYDGALLFITGGSVKDGIPNISKQDDGTNQFMAAVAAKNNAIVALLRQVPNQPLYGGLTEDALISYTLNEFKKDKDYSWPLLFPMVKSARKAMDAVQEFSDKQLKKKVNRFVVSGASKRGWTTWLTGASQDPRVVAIGPMVIDMLNMPATLEYQKELYGKYSDQINDYVKLEIPQAIKSEFGSAVVQMIDPYSYREKLTIPKMIFMGTNDEYWTVDAVKHYINEIPGQNYLHYVPNAGHSLGTKFQAMEALSAFFGLTLDKKPYPVCTWTLTEKGKNISLDVKTSPDQLVKAVLWTAQCDTRDFRKSQWSSSDIEFKKGDKSVAKASLKYPKTGYQAFYVDLVYSDPKGGEYSVSTRTYVSDSKQVFVK